MADFDHLLDASGLKCPLPVLRARKALADIARGQVLKVISTDQGSLKDFEAYSKQTNTPLLSAGEEGGKFIFLLRKA